MLSEHNREVLTNELGMPEAEVKALYAEGAIFHEEAAYNLPEELKKNGKSSGKNKTVEDKTRRRKGVWEQKETAQLT